MASPQSFAKQIAVPASAGLRCRTLPFACHRHNQTALHSITTAVRFLSKIVASDTSHFSFHFDSINTKVIIPGIILSERSAKTGEF